MKCRNCKNELVDVFADLGTSPASNSFLSKEHLGQPETYYPLKVWVCRHCFLVQLDEFKKHDSIFDENYVYFSSFSQSWLRHAADYSALAINRFKLNKDSFVVEVASNDGYLLKNFSAAGIPCLGIEPTSSTAKAARAIGINTREVFFGNSAAKNIAGEFGKCDLIVGNNVLAHVPDIHDFVSGFKEVLKPEGVVSLEFPHLKNLIQYNQFDTIYHEHFSYLALHSVQDIFDANGLRIFDVEAIPTHGGSLRVYGCLKNSMHATSERVTRLLNEEIEFGLKKLETYQGFQKSVEEIKASLLSFLIKAKKEGKKVAAYGAAAKGNTLINYCGLRSDLISAVADASPHKQNKFLPGSRIPVISPEDLALSKPDYIIVLPWYIFSEVKETTSRFMRSPYELVRFIPHFELSHG